MTTANDNHRSLILELIYKDAEDSVKFARDDLNAINARLGLVVGFDAALIRLSLDLPPQSSQTDSIVSSVALICYSCLLLKALTLILLVVSMGVSLRGVYPKAARVIIYPQSQLDKISEETSVEDFREGVIEKRDEVIRNLLGLSGKKTDHLRLSLTLLGLAATLAAVNVLIDLFCYHWN